jgi:hypothetical protein
MRASTQSVIHTSCSGSIVLTVSRSSVAWCPESGATIRTLGAGRVRGTAGVKRSSLQKGLSSATSMCAPATRHSGLS